MRVDIRATNVDLTDALQAYVERRVLFTLSRFSGTLRPIAVRISKITEDTRPPSYQCEVRTTLLRGKCAVVIEEDRNLFAAVARAVDRTGRAVERDLERRHRWGNRKPQRI